MHACTHTCKNAYMRAFLSNKRFEESNIPTFQRLGKPCDRAAQVYISIANVHPEISVFRKMAYTSHAWPGLYTHAVFCSSLFCIGRCDRKAKQNIFRSDMYNPKKKISTDNISPEARAWNSKFVILVLLSFCARTLLFFCTYVSNFLCSSGPSRRQQFYRLSACSKGSGNLTKASNPLQGLCRRLVLACLPLRKGMRTLLCLLPILTLSSLSQRASAPIRPMSSGFRTTCRNVVRREPEQQRTVFGFVGRRFTIPEFSARILGRTASSSNTGPADRMSADKTRQDLTESVLAVSWWSPVSRSSWS